MLLQTVRLHPTSKSTHLNGLLSEAILPINPGQAGSGYNSSDAWDYFHINSVDKDSEGNYLISARDACSVHKINGTTGDIIWRLDGTNSSFSLGPGVKFCFQHHARFVSRDGPIEIISLYDNSAHGTENGRGHQVHTAPTSSGKILRLDHSKWEAELLQGFYPPDDLLSKSQGSTQLLPSGNVLVNWGSEGALTEFRADGTPIFHTYMDSGFLGEGVENYRGFRYNWTGLPNEVPAVVCLEAEAEDGRSTSTSIYVSWNGDTETHTWRFYGVSDRSKLREFLGETKRTSFETALLLGNRKVEKVVAEAVNAKGDILVRSGVVRVTKQLLPSKTKADVVGEDEDEKLVHQTPLGQESDLLLTSQWEKHMILKYDRYSKSGRKDTAK